MIGTGETVAVGVSGGKDSMLLLRAMSHLSRFHPAGFKLYAITLDMGFDHMDFRPVAALCRELNVPYDVVRTDIRSVVFEDRKEKNPCSLCAKMRRGALHDAIRERGIRKVALGHHFDDAVETFFLSLLYEGRISCFEPVTYMSRADVWQLRPMLYVKEAAVIRAAERLALPIVPSTCPYERAEAGKRAEVKALIQTMSQKYPDLKNKVFGAMQRYPLKGWALDQKNQPYDKEQTDAGQTEYTHDQRVQPVNAQGNADERAEIV